MLLKSRDSKRGEQYPAHPSFLLTCLARRPAAMTEQDTLTDWQANMPPSNPPDTVNPKAIFARPTALRSSSEPSSDEEERQKVGQTSDRTSRKKVTTSKKRPTTASKAPRYSAIRPAAQDQQEESENASRSKGKKPRARWGTRSATGTSTTPGELFKLIHGVSLDETTEETLPVDEKKDQEEEELAQVSHPASILVVLAIIT